MSDQLMGKTDQFSGETRFSSVAKPVSTKRRIASARDRAAGWDLSHSSSARIRDF
jgi:hypothetical protein